MFATAGKDYTSPIAIGLCIGVIKPESQHPRSLGEAIANDHMAPTTLSRQCEDGIVGTLLC